MQSCISIKSSPLKMSTERNYKKFKKVKKSGCGTDEVYVSKLSWFKDATYLSEVVTTRSSTSNLVSKFYELLIYFITDAYYVFKTLFMPF